MENAIEIRDLSKSFHNALTGEDVLAVDHLNLDIHSGEIFGFLGPNGAGKTTTIKMLLGLIFPTSGTAHILGQPPGEIEMRRRISYLPESPYFYEHLSGYEVLDFYAMLFGIAAAERRKRVEDLLTQVGLGAQMHKRLRYYSKGMLQRVGLAQSLVNGPDVLFLDEPTSGLDPIAHLDIRDLILRTRDEGRTVFLSSHQLSDVEMVCDRVSILHHGKLLKVGVLKELLAEQATEIVARGVEAEKVHQIQQAAPSTQVEDGTLRSQVQPAEVSHILELVLKSGGTVVSVTPIQRTLEDIFIETIRGGQPS